MGSHVTGTDGQIQRIPLRIASPSSIFPPDLAPCDHFLFPNQEMIRRKDMHHQRAAHRRNRNLFWRVGQIILFGRLEKVGDLLDQVYRADRRLCWQIKMNRSKKMCFTKSYWFTLVHLLPAYAMWNSLKCSMLTRLVLVLFLSVDESNFERSFFSSSVSLVCVTLVRFFCHDIFSLHFNVANDIVFLIFKLNWRILAVSFFALDAALIPIFWGKAIVTWIADMSYS